MKDLCELVQRYTIHHDRNLKKICSPLEILGIPIFVYFRIQADGCFGVLSNYPNELDFYYSENFHLHNPYLIHPSLIQSGFVLTTASPHNPSLSKRIFHRNQIYHLLLILKKYSETIEGYIFTAREEKVEDSTLNTEFMAKLRQFYLFTHYFKHEANPLIGKMMRENFSLKETKGEEFFKISGSHPLLISDPQIVAFEKAVFPLTRRERQCLELFKQGNSSQATAGLLGLSQRTVEHYFENIKNKLNCRSKWDLLEW